MLNNSLEVKSHDVSWASQSDLLMEILEFVSSIISFHIVYYKQMVKLLYLRYLY